VPEPLVRRAGLLEDEQGLHLITLSVLLLDLLGPEYLFWTSEALREELQERYGKIGVVTWERVQALRILHVHDAYWQEWEVFEKVTAAICGEPPIFSLVQPQEAEEVFISLSTASRIDQHDFDEDVRSYMVAACLNDGLWYFEEPVAAVGSSELVELDTRQGIQRPFGLISAELEKSNKFRPESDDPVLTQVNRVLEVRQALRLYNEAVDRQLLQLPQLLKGV